MMKNMKRHTKPVISIVLALVLIVSTVAVGIIATNAAYLNGKPNGTAAANAADAGTAGAKADAASVGAKAPEAVGAKVDSDSVGWDTSKCGINLKIGSANTQWLATDSNGLVSFTVSSTSTIKYELTAEYGGSQRWYKKASGTGAPSESSLQSYDYYAKWDGKDGSDSFSFSVSAGTYNVKLESLEQDGDQLKYKFWKTSTSYNITYNNPTNGSFTTKPTSANSGASVSIVATPSTGYQVESFTVTNSSTSAAITTANSGNTYTFTMPSANVSVSATFSKRDYTITKSQSNCTISVTGGANTAQYGDTVSFTVTPDTDYALKTLTVKQGSTTITNTSTGENTYSFTMPAGNVTITAVCATTTGTLDVYFKSATAWVYHPVISINDGAEQLMTIDSYLDDSTNSYKPKSPTGSLRYGWYKVSLTGVDTSKPVSIFIKGQDSSMEATGTFTLGSGDSVYLACDNIMEGSTLVDLSNKSDAVKDFYESPLHMVATAAEEAALNN